MTAKEYLSRAYRTDQRINSKLEQVQSLRNLAEKASAILSGISAGRDPHQIENTIAKMMDLETVINTDLKQLVDTKHEIITMIKCVEPTQLQTLLEMRYLNFLSWEQIADIMNVTIRHVFKIHGKALNEVESIRKTFFTEGSK